MQPDPVKLILSEVNVAVPAGPGVEAGMVVLAETEDPHRRLRIVIAQPEARAIQAAWTGVIPVRPSTWDLFVSAVAILGGRIDRVVITAVVEERHFFASLELERDGEQRILSCRPSDAVAVALRAYGAEIYAAREVLDTVGLASDGTKYGPYVKAEPPEPSEVPAPADAVGAVDAVAELEASAPEAAEMPGAPARGAGRTRSGRLPRKASPRTAVPVRKAGTRATEAGAPANSVRKAAGPANPVRKAAAPAKKAGAPVRKRTPPAR